jgi:peroxiredoxin
MAQLEPAGNQIEQAGAQLVYIAAEKREGMWKPANYLNKNPISFPFLLDEDRSVSKAYGVYQRMGTDAIHIARPASFVIGRDGALRYVYRSSNQLERAPLEQIIAAVNQLKG